MGGSTTTKGRREAGRSDFVGTLYYFANPEVYQLMLEIDSHRWPDAMTGPHSIKPPTLDEVESIFFRWNRRK